VVSGGLDFSIRHFLAQKGWLNSVSIFAPKAKHTANGVTLTFPKRFDEMSANFKDDLVRNFRKEGKRVIYMGNDLGDYSAVKIADLSFAIKDSRLSELCRNGGVACIEITDFQQVVESIKVWVSLAEKKA
jgi:2-hydroxy-3-keto-5-methylthiopentenyl-1-phosphate phosphatase